MSTASVTAACKKTTLHKFVPKRPIPQYTSQVITNALLLCTKVSKNAAASRPGCSFKIGLPDDIPARSTAPFPVCLRFLKLSTNAVLRTIGQKYLPCDYPLRQDNHSSHDERDRQIQKQPQKIQTEISAKILPQHFPLKNQQKCADTD